MQISVCTIHRQPSGKGPMPAGPVARGRVFDQVAALGLELASGDL